MTMARDAETDRAFHEVYAKEPRVVRRTRRTFGAKRARKQQVAIALAKARRATRRRRSVM